MNVKQRFYLGLLVIVLGFSGTIQVYAKNVTGLPPALSKATAFGIVDGIYTKGKEGRNEIVIGDWSSAISPTLAVRSYTGRLVGGLDQLGPGQKIAYRIEKRKVNGKRINFLVEAWLLPSNFKLPGRR